MGVDVAFTVSIQPVASSYQQFSRIYEHFDKGITN
jgi:hypothetical protein